MSISAAGMVAIGAWATGAIATAGYLGYRGEKQDALAFPRQLEAYEQARAQLPANLRDQLTRPRLGIGDAWGGAFVTDIGVTMLGMVALAAVNVATPIPAGAMFNGAAMIGAGAFFAYGIGGHVGRAMHRPNEH